MTLPVALAGLVWLGVTAYALLGGADFGGGIWDLLAGRTRPGAPARSLIEHAIGPVWEANHVWLIFVLVVLWTCFPAAFAAIASTLWLPLTLIAFGVIARGSAFAFRKAVTETWQRRLFGAIFAFSSLVTPFFLGAVAGAIATGRVPPGIARGGVLSAWVNPASLFSGGFAVAACAYLAAVYLTGDANRSGEPRLVAAFRRRALVSGVLVGLLAAAGLAVLHANARPLYQGLVDRALPLVAFSATAGLTSLGLLIARRYTLVRITAAAAVAAVLWGWGVAQYPHLLNPGLTIAAGAAPAATLRATAVSLGVGAVLLVPSLVFMYALFQRGRPPVGDRPGPGPPQGGAG
ncbi:MAG TPA: cytochrome d ubiquinol oxidase subunit II [Streptosporangiaceae bacterium]